MRKRQEVGLPEAGAAGAYIVSPSLRMADGRDSMEGYTTHQLASSIRATKRPPYFRRSVGMLRLAKFCPANQVCLVHDGKVQLRSN